MIRNILTTAVLFIMMVQLNFAQGSAGSKAAYETRYIVDMPTAGLNAKSNFSIYTQFFNEGGAYIEFSYSPLTNIELSASFSGTGFIGNGVISGQGIPGGQLRIRLINETLSFPAVLIGVTNQGKGSYYKNEKRFEMHAPGVFASASKNFKWWPGSLAIHGGLNFGFVSDPAYRIVNGYLGFEQSFAKNLAWNFEFRTDFFDPEFKSPEIINTSVRWTFYPGFTLEFLIRDLLSNARYINGLNRGLGIEFNSSF